MPFLTLVIIRHFDMIDTDKDELNGGQTDG